MAIYCRIPAEIEAVQWKQNEMLIYDVMEQFGGFDEMKIKSIGLNNGKLIIKTLKGEMTANDGDYIIRRANGDFYACKPDVFERTYTKFN